MNLYIPSIHDRIRLTKDWEFALFLESRNIALAVRLRPTMRLHPYGDHRKSIMAKLPAGTEMAIERIYVRSGKKDYDSITFGIKNAPGDEKLPPLKKKGCGWYYVSGGAKIDVSPAAYDTDEFIPAQSAQIVQLTGGRFWAKLDDVNTIEYVRC